jgi:hypothetical protein
MYPTLEERWQKMPGFPSSPVSPVTIYPDQTLSGVQYSFSRISFSASKDRTTFVGKCWVGIIDSDGFRLVKCTASGPDLITAAQNLSVVIAEFS